MATAAAKRELMERVTQFIYREARLQDTHQWADWESLWADDGIYWVPGADDDADPDKTMSIIYDNRSRISLRIKQLYTGKRYSQTPKSRLCRVVSNIEIIDDNDDELTATSNMVLFESHPIHGQLMWAARTEYTLRRDDDTFKMVRKKVCLPHSEHALNSMAFLI